MIKLFYTVLGSLAATLLFAACGAKPGAATAERVAYAEDAECARMVYDSVAYADSVTDGDNVAIVSLNAYFPVSQGDELSDSIRAWVCAQFDDSTAMHLKNPAEALRAYGKNQIYGDFGNLLVDYVESEYEVRLYDDIDVRPIYEDADVVTFGCQRSVYFGGAHGSTLIDYRTFSRKDGHVLGWELTEDMSREEIVKAIKAGLREYFEVADDAALLEELLIGAFLDDADRQRVFDTDFPLPALPPWRDSLGVHVLYQQYEIAPFSAGMPTCIIKK